MIKPSIGRVVWYKDRINSDQFLPALICYVFSDTTINIGGFTSDGAPFHATSVPLHQEGAETCPDRSACWMPYQQKQEQKAQETANQTAE